jgi:hypothetical protein
MGVDTKWLAKHFEEQEARMSDEKLIHELRNSKGWPTLGNAAADRIEELISERDEAWKRAAHAEKMWGEAEVKLAKALTALGDVQWFVKDLEPYADQGHTLVPALQKACAVYVELTGGKNG